MQTGLVFNIQKYSVHDGPGIRTTVFLKGCPLGCAWCHNPESQSPRPEMMVIESRCTACGECRTVCPFGHTLEGAGPLPARMPDCTLCGACADACPSDARQVVGESMTVGQVMKTVLQDRMFYEDSNGGATFSGGEPLTQPRFLTALLGACRDEGIRTAVDTCGFACTDTLLEVAKLADLFLYDIKMMDDARHRQYTGVSNAPILENLSRLDKVHDNIWVRVPVIPGVNDNEANFRDLANFVLKLSNIKQVNLLPYHTIGLSKSRRLGQVNLMEGVQPPSAESMEKAAAFFEHLGLKTKIGG